MCQMSPREGKGMHEFRMGGIREASSVPSMICLDLIFLWEFGVYNFPFWWPSAFFDRIAWPTLGWIRPSKNLGTDSIRYCLALVGQSWVTWAMQENVFNKPLLIFADDMRQRGVERGEIERHQQKHHGLLRDQSVSICDVSHSETNNVSRWWSAPTLRLGPWQNLWKLGLDQEKMKIWLKRASSNTIHH